MSKALPALNPQLIALVLLLLLACGPLERLQELSRTGRVVATGVAIASDGNYQAFDGFQNLQRLPGYRLESQSLIRNPGSRLDSVVTISHHDNQGNSYTLTQTQAGQRTESYLINGQTYIFEPEYDGWVEVGAAAPDTLLYQPATIIQLLARFGAVPKKAGQETLQGRAATRYRLEYVLADLTQAAQAGGPPTELTGHLWLDDQTGALLKAEILFYQQDAAQPAQEFYLTVSDIGNVALIKLPAPVIDPAAAAAATATAQAWAVLPAELDYQGQRITFELVPLHITPAAGNPDLSELHVMVRQLPANLTETAEVRPFLEQLGRQLSLSIPKHNQVIPSANIQLEHADLPHHTLEAVVQFEAKLAGLSHVELILASPGNPLFAPVPVTGAE